MLTQLTIQGLAIIDSLSIGFAPGFNVITGETGAGKSILIRALGLLTGAKAGPDAVRKGSEQATVSAEFLVPATHAALQVLRELGIGFEEIDGEISLLVRRQVSAKGRAQAWVNDIAVTTQVLREVGLTLLDVFGQHENQRLMDAVKHVDYLDDFLKDDGCLERVEKLNRACLLVVQELKQTVDRFQQSQRDSDYLTFRLGELRAFGPSEEDFTRVSALCKRADRSASLRDSLSRALSCLEGGEGESGVGKALWDASRLLGGAAQPPQDEGSAKSLAELKERAAHVATEVDDIGYELGKLLSSFDFDEEELETAQSRLFGYQELFRKHASRDIEALMGESAKLERELGSLETFTAHLSDLLETLCQNCAELKREAAVLSASRKQAAIVIKKYVESELHELAMPGAIFEAELTPISRTLPEIDFTLFDPALQSAWRKVRAELSAMGDGGAERAQFLLASNPGEPILPLARVASGGELSRIMLALKKALAADAETCVLVFDEIDTGISGRVADVVGRKMRELAGSFQVLCISHLPQVAVYADQHLLVKKEGKKDRTESTILSLSPDESAREIARLLSGSEVSTSSLENARTLIERARGEQPKAKKAAKKVLPKKLRPQNQAGRQAEHQIG